MTRIAYNFLYVLTCFFVFFEKLAHGQEKLNDGDTYEYVTFASGCFWYTQHDFDQVKGLITTTTGYTGGEKENPTYKEVSAGGSGHVESLQVKYDPKVVSYQQLLDFYWLNVDPTRNDGQFF